MKLLLGSVLVCSWMAGCASMNPAPGGQPGTGPLSTVPDSGTPQVSLPLDNDIGPRLVIPATGGAPVMGIPLGGTIFLPVTGGMPVIGIPIGP